MVRSVPAAQQIDKVPAIWTRDINSDWNKITKELRKVILVLFDWKSTVKLAAKDPRWHFPASQLEMEQHELGECEAFISTFILVGGVFKAIAEDQSQLLISGTVDDSGADSMKELMKRILGDAYELVHAGSVQRAFAHLASKLFPPESVYCGMDASNLQLLGILSSSENVCQFFMRPILLGNCDAEYKEFLQSRASSNARKIAAAYTQARLQWDKRSSKIRKLCSTPLLLPRLTDSQHSLADPFSSISRELQSADTAATSACSHSTLSQVRPGTLHSEIPIDPELSRSYTQESHQPDIVEARSQLRRTWVELEQLLTSLTSHVTEEQNTLPVAAPDTSGQ